MRVRSNRYFPTCTWQKFDKMFMAVCSFIGFKGLIHQVIVKKWRSQSTCDDPYPHFKDCLYVQGHLVYPSSRLLS